MKYLVLMVMTIFCLVGCESSGLPGAKGTAHGKVTMGNKPFPVDYRVQMMHRGGTAYSTSAALKADGTFSLEGRLIPIGIYGVAVSPKPMPELSPEELEERAKNPAKFAPEVSIPTIYQIPETSNITIEIKENADTEVNIDLPESKKP